MTVREAADILGLSEMRVRHLIKSGHIRGERGRYGVYTLRSDDVEAIRVADRAPGKRLPKPGD